MAPSLNLRPRTRDADRPSTALGESNLISPSRTSSLHSRITQPLPSQLSARPEQRSPKTLTHAYMVCGVGREPSQWVKAPAPSQGKLQHMKGAVGQFWLPEILGSSPRFEQDSEMARSLHAAMRACFPHDVEIGTGKQQPHCVHHSFVLQQDSSHTLYGIALRVWSRADERRTETIQELRARTENDYMRSADETYWIPYCLSFLSRYPLYNLLGDYLRGMWIHWNKASNLFHAEEVSRILNFPAPRLNDLVRIDMKDYALCYQFPASPTDFQNFALWPLFACLSIPNIVGVVEAAVSSSRRIIFVSHYPAMLTVAAETVRYMVRTYEWSGLYVPVVHARHAKSLVDEPGPYILGLTAECRTLFTAPNDALVVDLDRNFVLTSNPPSTLTTRQRDKMINRMSKALSDNVLVSGVPPHLRSAYGGGKLVPAGQIIVMRGEVDNIQDPDWWNQDAVMSVMDHMCHKLGRRTGVKAMFGGTQKKPLMTKVSMRYLNETVRERNQNLRDATDAWQELINLKGRMDTELSKSSKRNNFLVEELETWKRQFLKIQELTDRLTKETSELKDKTEKHKRENQRLTKLIKEYKDSIALLEERLSGTEKQRDNALETLRMQQEITEALEHERKRNGHKLQRQEERLEMLSRDREAAQHAALQLCALIGGQTQRIQHIVRQSKSDRESNDYSELGSLDARDGLETDGHNETFDSRQIGASTARAVESRASSRASRRFSTRFSSDGSPDTDSRSPLSSKRMSTLSMTDTADQHLREKTDAICDIINIISQQCAAAVNSLHQAQKANNDSSIHSEHDSQLSGAGSERGSDTGDDEPANHLHPDDRHSSIPPTPDLVHNRSSTSMSMASASTTPDRRSMQQYAGNDVLDVPTKIIEADDALFENQEPLRDSLSSFQPFRNGKGNSNEAAEESMYHVTSLSKHPHNIRRSSSDRRLVGESG